MNKARLISGTGRRLTRMGATPAFAEGLYELAVDTYAWLVPNGSWGETNLGIVRCGSESVMIDTCWDLHFTREMLEHAAPILGSAPVSLVINTHADGDHCWGNQFFAGQPMLCTAACAAQMSQHTPRQLSALQRASALLRRIPLGDVDALGSYLGSMLKPYRFDGIGMPGANRTFSGSTSVEIGNTLLALLEVGPAHTNGDCIVHIPSRRIVYVGDILFVGITPVAWAGPVANIVRALKRVQALDAEVIVPGHGPLATAADVQLQIDYWEWLSEALSAQASRGVEVDLAAQHCLTSPTFLESEFSRWPAAERLFTSACTLYREWGIPTAKHKGMLGQLDHFRRQARLQRS